MYYYINYIYDIKLKKSIYLSIDNYYCRQLLFSHKLIKMSLLTAIVVYLNAKDLKIPNLKINVLK